MQKNQSLVSKIAYENMDYIKKAFHSPRNKDVIMRDFKIVGNRNCVVAYIDGMASTIAVNDFIVRPLMQSSSQSFDMLNVIEYNNLSVVTNMNDVVMRMLQGDTVIFVDGDDRCAVCETKGFDKRSVSSPKTEAVIKGSQEAFNESLRSDITLIRRAVKSPDLITEMISIGDISGEICAVLYLDNVTDPRLVEKAKRRLKLIKADYVSGSGMIEQMIGDSRWSLFPSVLTTERPERAAQYLNAGRIVIICDNSPFAIILPVKLSEFLDSPEGNQQRWQNGTFTKLIRSFAFICTLLLSALYIAIINYHHDMLPQQLLLLIAKSRSQIPFSSLMELIVMELFFELVREAGVRIPSAVGGAIGVVGGLILGSAAIEAGIASPVTLIIVAVSGLSNSVLPDYDLSFGITVSKFALIILGGVLGLYGVFFGIAILILMLSNQKSLGSNYIEPPFSQSTTNSNAFVQLPLWKQQFRSNLLGLFRKRQQPKFARGWEEDEQTD